MADDLVISVKRVNKNYGGEFDALSNINFDLAKGEMAFLTGHSGAGKSTLLKLLSFLERPTNGEIFFNGANTNHVAAKHLPFMRRQVGVIFQNPHLLNDRSVFDNVALPLIIAGYRQTEIKRRVRAALDKVGLLLKEKLTPHTLSGGEQQRIGIARAVVNKPQLLLADEPTGNLDPELSAEIMGLFEQFNQVGVSVLVASHDLRLIVSMRHRIMELKSGRMVTTGENAHYDS